ncbi:hypothetical protein H5410_039495, partial [Solanum commersonii]
MVFSNATSLKNDRDISLFGLNDLLKVFSFAKNNTNKLILVIVVSRDSSVHLALGYSSTHGNSKKNYERKSLLPTLCKTAITSLKFSKYCHLLVEIMSSLDLVEINMNVSYGNQSKTYFRMYEQTFKNKETFL